MHFAKSVFTMLHLSSKCDWAPSRDHSFTTIFVKRYDQFGTNPLYNIFPHQICGSNWSRNYFRVGRIQNPTSNPTCAVATHTRPHGSVWFRDPYSEPWVDSQPPNLHVAEFGPHPTFWEVPKGYDDSDLINFASMFFWWNCDRAISWIVIWWTFWLSFFQFKHDFWKKWILYVEI